MESTVSDSNLLKSELRIAKKSAKNEKVRHSRDCHFGMRQRSCVSKKVRHFCNHPFACTAHSFSLLLIARFDLARYTALFHSLTRNQAQEEEIYNYDLNATI